MYVGIGAVADVHFLADLLREHVQSRHILIADRRVHSILGRRLASRLRDHGLELEECLVPSTEASKSADTYWGLVDQALAAGIDKNSYVITVGGGVVNNVGGFVAATVFRGLPLIHLPTSLMAQLDASIDVRQAINHYRGKNLVGSIYAPRAVVVDPSLLRTLPSRYLRSGIAEAIKHSLTQSPEFLRFLKDNAASLIKPKFLEYVVRHTITYKLALINRRVPAIADVYLQYGHCLGHAIETASGYRLLHGEAIAIGMTISAEIALSMGLCQSSLVNEHISVFRAYKLPVAVPDYLSVDSIMDAIRYDKYSRHGTPRMALLRKVGRLHRSRDGLFVPINAEVVRRHLEISQAQGKAYRRRAQA